MKQPTEEFLIEKEIELLKNLWEKALEFKKTEYMALQDNLLVNIINKILQVTNLPEVSQVNGLEDSEALAKIAEKCILYTKEIKARMGRDSEVFKYINTVTIEEYKLGLSNGKLFEAELTMIKHGDLISNQAHLAEIVGFLLAFAYRAQPSNYQTIETIKQEIFTGFSGQVVVPFLQDWLNTETLDNISERNLFNVVRLVTGDWRHKIAYCQNDPSERDMGAIKGSNESDRMCDPVSNNEKWSAWKKKIENKIKDVLSNPELPENANYKVTDIYDNKYSKLMPGDEPFGSIYGTLCHKNEAYNGDNKISSAYYFSYEPTDNVQDIEPKNITCVHTICDIDSQIKLGAEIKQLINCSNEELKNTLLGFIHDFAGTSSFERGQAAILEWLIKAVAKIHDCNITFSEEWKNPNIDQQALSYLDKEEFILVGQDNLFIEFTDI